MNEFIKKVKKTNIRQLKFFVLVFALVVLLVSLSVYTVFFLLTNLNKALSADKDIKTSPLLFEIERFERLNLKK